MQNKILILGSGQRMNTKNFWRGLNCLVKIGTKYSDTSAVVPVHKRVLMHKSFSAKCRSQVSSKFQQVYLKKWI